MTSLIHYFEGYENCLLVDKRDDLIDTKLRAAMTRTSRRLHPTEIKHVHLPSTFDTDVTE